MLGCNEAKSVSNTTKLKSLDSLLQEVCIINLYLQVDFLAGLMKAPLNVWHPIRPHVWVYIKRPTRLEFCVSELHLEQHKLTFFHIMAGEHMSSLKIILSGDSANAVPH